MVIEYSMRLSSEVIIYIGIIEYSKFLTFRSNPHFQKLHHFKYSKFLTFRINTVFPSERYLTTYLSTHPHRYNWALNIEKITPFSKMFLNTHNLSWVLKVTPSAFLNWVLTLSDSLIWQLCTWRIHIAWQIHMARRINYGTWWINYGIWRMHMANLKIMKILT